uniref:Uncharacterized protein n=1 Tax=Physcomitrium patens TaxID=3218 RepID=A0A2K1JIW4_PHYPA|nr:hypothetical protein PHYPA_018900 [Physcomitrium patens]
MCTGGVDECARHLLPTKNVSQVSPILFFSITSYSM